MELTIASIQLIHFFPDQINAKQLCELCLMKHVCNDQQYNFFVCFNNSIYRDALELFRKLIIKSKEPTFLLQTQKQTNVRI